jgi:hypothetical protein
MMIPKPNILTTPFAKTYNMNAMSKQAARFLLANKKNADMEDHGYETLLSNVNTMTFSHMTTMFRNIVDHNKLSSIYLFSYARSLVKDIPELLTIDDVVVDGKFIPSSVTPDLQRAWVNLTPVLTSNKKDRLGSVQIADIPKAVSSVVRAFLCTSYNDSDEWLPPKISAFVIEFYTMAMSSVLIRSFNLDWEEAHLVQLLFAWYYASLLGPNKDNDNEPILLHKNRQLFKGIANTTQLDELFGKINGIRDGRPMSIDIITEVIRSIGPARMKNLKGSDVYRLFSLSTADSTAMMIAVDYPPYFVHQILRTVSGAKHPILSNVLNTRMNKSNVLKTMDLLVRERSIFNGVNR